MSKFSFGKSSAVILSKSFWINSAAKFAFFILSFARANCSLERSTPTTSAAPFSASHQTSGPEPQPKTKTFFPFSGGISFTSFSKGPYGPQTNPRLKVGSHSSNHCLATLSQLFPKSILAINEKIIRRRIFLLVSANHLSFYRRWQFSQKVLLVLAKNILQNRFCCNPVPRPFLSRIHSYSLKRYLSVELNGQVNEPVLYRYQYLTPLVSRVSACLRMFLRFQHDRPYSYPNTEEICVCSERGGVSKFLLLNLQQKRLLPENLKDFLHKLLTSFSCQQHYRFHLQGLNIHQVYE